MATFTLIYHPKVVRDDIPALDNPTRQRIRAAIEAKLGDYPEQHAKPLAHTKQGLWSLRVGDWRVVFAMREGELWVLRIGNRRDVYNDLSRRAVPPRS